MVYLELPFHFQVDGVLTIGLFCGFTFPSSLCECQEMCLCPAGQLLRQRVRGRRPSRQPGGASPGETAAQGQGGHPEEGRCQALGAAQVRPRVQGRREKPLTSLSPKCLPLNLCVVEPLPPPHPLAVLSTLLSAPLLVASCHFGCGLASVFCMCTAYKRISFFAFK